MCCILTSNHKLPLLFQTDTTKVETVQDVLARAAAKGLLGGIIPEQAKPGKKGKSRKNGAGSASSKPSSPSRQDRQPGREPVDDDPVAPLEHEEKGECHEEEEKGGKARRGLKGSKRKVKRRQKPNKAVSKHPPKNHRKKSTKRKVNQSHHKRRLTKSKPRRIPRLTLTLMSSAKPPNHLSPITALAHKLSDNPAIKSRQTVLSPARPAPLTPRAGSEQGRRHNPEPERAGGTPKDAVRPETQFKARGKLVRGKTELETQGKSKPDDFVLPPIPFPSPSSLSSRSGSSVSQRPSRASSSQLAPISASSSSVSLPGL